MSANTFKDIENHIDYLDELNNSEFSSEYCNSKYFEEESILGYKSYRAKINKIDLEDLGWNEENEFPEKRVNTASMQSIFNENLELIIDGDYYNFTFKDHYIFVADVTDQSILFIRKHVNSFTSIADFINYLNTNGINSEMAIDSRNLSKKVRGTEHRRIQDQTGGNILVDIDLTSPGNCSSSRTVSFSNILIQNVFNQTNIPLNGTCTIDWGDGNQDILQSQAFLFGVPVASTGILLNQTHTYTGAQTTFPITISFTTGINLVGVGSVSFNLEISKYVLAVSQSKKIWHYPVINGVQHAIKVETYVQNNFIKQRFGAETTTYRWSGSTNKLFKSQSISVHVNGTDNIFGTGGMSQSTLQIANGKTSSNCSSVSVWKDTPLVFPFTFNTIYLNQAVIFNSGNTLQNPFNFLTACP